MNQLPIMLKSESTYQSKQIARYEPVTCQVTGLYCVTKIVCANDSDTSNSTFTKSYLVPMNTQKQS